MRVCAPEVPKVCDLELYSVRVKGQSSGNSPGLDFAVAPAVAPQLFNADRHR